MKKFFLGAVNTPGPAGIKAGIYQTGCGHLYLTDHSIIDRARHDCLVIYCVCGKGDFTLDGYKTEISAGDIFAMSSGLKHSYNSDRCLGWEIYWIHFDGRLSFELIQWAGLGKENLKINCGINEKMIYLFQETLEINKKKDYLYLDVSFPGILYQIFGHVKASVLRSEGRISIDKFEKLFEKNLMELNIDQMASQVGLSKFHFIREFKRKTGSTPGQYLINKKITVAKELLSNKQLPIKQIAYKLGFDDTNYFSRLFKNKTGLSASQFRKKMLEI